MLHIQSFEFNPFAENSFVIFDDAGLAVVIDPGCSTRQEEKQLTRFIEMNKLTVSQLVNTHCHIDHVLGNAFVKTTYGVPLLIHQLEEPVLRSVKVYAPAYGFPNYQEVLPDNFLQEGDTLQVGNESLTVMYVPGHSPGHIALYHEKSRSLFGGDVLFQGSIGRTDLPGGDFDKLIKSIQSKLFTLPDDVTVYCGHGDTTTIGAEKKTNPFCAIRNE